MDIIPNKASTNYRLTWRDSIIVICFVAAVFHPVTRAIAFGLAIAWAGVSAYRRIRSTPSKEVAPRDVLDSDDDDNVIH